MFLNCLLPVDVVITADKRKLCVFTSANLAASETVSGDKHTYTDFDLQ